MKNALIISLGLHIATGFAWFRVVKISHVRFIPRQVYTVNLLTPSEAARGVEKKVTPLERPTPRAKVEKREDLVPPSPKPKPKKQARPKPKEIQKTVQPETREPEDAREFESAESGEQPVTSDIVIEGQDFPFAYYITTMRRKIAAGWRVPGASAAGPMHCRVYFRVGRDGTIQSPTMETASGNFLFDQAALRAVLHANPLPALPGGFSDDFLGVHFSFSFEEE